MRAIADRLEIRALSLYKHIADKNELEVALIAVGFTEQAAAFTSAIQRSEHPVIAIAIADAYRQWALAHPHLYRLMTDSHVGGPSESEPVAARHIDRSVLDVEVPEAGTGSGRLGLGCPGAVRVEVSEHDRGEPTELGSLRGFEGVEDRTTDRFDVRRGGIGQPSLPLVGEREEGDASVGRAAVAAKKTASFQPSCAV